MRRASRRRPTRRTPAPPTRINITLTNTTRATPPNRVLFRRPLLAAALPQSARLALPLEKHENVAPRIGPFTLRTIEREGSSRNSTRTWVT